MKSIREIINDLRIKSREGETRQVISLADDLKRAARNRELDKRENYATEENYQAGILTR